MGNFASHSPNDLEDGCKEAEDKLKECVLAHFDPKIKEISDKLEREFDKAAAFHDEDDEYYMRKGACKESAMRYAECPNRDTHGTMRECMEAHSNYYHKYLSMCESIEEQFKEEVESIYPFIDVERAHAHIDVHEMFKDGDYCCKEQYAAYKGCCPRSRRYG